MLCVLALAMISVTLSVLGPKILGHATNIIFAGVIGKRLPANVSLQQAVDAARARGDNNFADLIAGMDVVPGTGIDFTALGHVLLLALALYVGANLLAWLQGYLLNGLVQNTVLRLRADVEDKINRLPLPYFDQQPRGELLSRVTNDIDNISTEPATDAEPTADLAAHRHRRRPMMMFVISPLLALIALVTIPVSMVVTKAIAKRSQKQFIAQWKHTGG